MESLATLLDVVVNFQPEVSCRLHAIVLIIPWFVQTVQSDFSIRGE